MDWGGQALASRPIRPRFARSWAGRWPLPQRGRGNHALETDRGAMLRANPRHRPLTKSGLDVVRYGPGLGVLAAGEPGAVRLCPFELEPRWRAGSPVAPSARPVGGSPRFRTPTRSPPGSPVGPWLEAVSPLEARVSPEFRAAMSVGRDTLSRNRPGGKRLVKGGCAEPRGSRWITRARKVDGFRKPSQSRRLSCPQFHDRSGPKRRLEGRGGGCLAERARKARLSRAGRPSIPPGGASRPRPVRGGRGRRRGRR